MNIVKAGLAPIDFTTLIPISEEMFADRPARAMMGNRQLETDDIANVFPFLASSVSDLIQGKRAPWMKEWGALPDGAYR